jgi:GDP-L-fucose synthase
VTVWGTRKASREFPYVDDAAEGILLPAEHYNNGDAVNLGRGKEITMHNLVEMIARLDLMER